MEGGAAPGAGRVGIPAPSHWVRDSVAACEGITPLDSSWKAVWEGGCCCIGGWLGTRYAKGIAEAGMFE